MSGIVYTPNEHVCRPGWTYKWHEHDASCVDESIPAIARCSFAALYPEQSGYTAAIPPKAVREGAVWECDCGKTFVATYPFTNVFVPTFRREGWWEKRRRLRAKAAIASADTESEQEPSKEH